MMPSQFLVCKHPLLLPMLMAEVILEYTTMWMRNLHRDLKEVEKLTEFGAVGEVETPAETIHYHSLTRKLGMLHINFSYSYTALLTLQRSVGFLQQKVLHMDETLP